MTASFCKNSQKWKRFWCIHTEDQEYLGNADRSQAGESQSQHLDLSWMPIDILTKIWVIEEDELLPAVLGHHLQDDLVKVDWRADHQGVVVCSWQATGQRAGGARRPSGRALDEEVGDVHGVGERLKTACWHAADGTDQCQNSAIHQLAGWREKGGAERKEGSCYSQNTQGNRKKKYGTPVASTSSQSLPLFVG